MKTRFFTLAACLFCCCATAKADDPVGRYTLIAGTFTTSTGDEQKVILKMDTTTGETWLYESLSWEIKPKVNALVEGWRTVKPDADTEWMAIIKKFPNGRMTGPSKP